MLHAVLDSTVLVSAFLRPNGVAGLLLEAAKQHVYPCSLATEIIDETAHTLRYPRIQRRYAYTSADITTFCEALRVAFPLARELPPLMGVSRDPGDDVILACAVAVRAAYLITRDNDLLSLGIYEGITILTPETFVSMLRAAQLLP
jgi:uncharacterized protein